MVGKELKKLSRRELVDVIYQMKRNEQELQVELESLREELQNKRIRLENAGSIADAAAGITQLLTSAQETADLYLSEIACMKSETERECARLIAEAKIKADEIIARAKEGKADGEEK